MRRAWAVCVVVLLIAGGWWAGATLRIDTEVLSLMPADLPAVRGLAGFQHRAISDREVFVVADPGLGEDARAELLAELRPRLEAAEGVAAVTAPGEDWGQHWPELTAWALWNLPPETFKGATAAFAVERARERLAAIPEALAGAVDAAELGRLQMDPLGIFEAVSSTGSGVPVELPGDSPAFLIVRADRALGGFQECIAFTDAVRGAISGVSGAVEKLRITGRPAFTAEISRQMRADMLLMVGAAVVLVCGAFWLFYRTLLPLGWILLFQFLALNAGLIVARFAFGTLNLISMGFASILLGVSMDYSVLVYHHFASGHGADAAGWARLRRGIWFSAIITAAAFLATACTSFPGLRQLGILVATGLLASAWFATWMLPMVLAHRPPTAPPLLDWGANAAADLAVKHRRWILFAATAGCAFAALVVLRDPRAFYSSEMNQFQPTQSEAWEGQQWLAASDPSQGAGIFVVRAGSWEGVRQAGGELVAQLGNGSGAPQAYLVPAPQHQTANANAWKRGTFDALRGAFEAAGLEEEWSGPTLRMAKTLEAAGKRDSFSAIAPILDSMAKAENGRFEAIVHVPGARPGASAAFVAESLPGVEILPVSWPALGSDLAQRAREDAEKLGGWMMAALTVLCAAAHRSARLVFLNGAALLITLLALALLLRASGTQLSPLSLLSIPLLLGLVIDYSIHVLIAIDHHRGDLRATYSHLAAPVLLTGLAACIGFGAPMLTRQPALRNFGMVMDLGIFSAVMTCLVVLPLLYRASARLRAR